MFLLDASSGLERRVLQAWIEREAPEHAGFDAAAIPPSRRRRRNATPEKRLPVLLAAGDDPLLAPLRVAWLPARRRDGGERLGFWELLLLGDPRDPGRLRQRWIRARSPERCQVVSGEPAPLSELRGRWQAACGVDGAETTGLSEFVARQAALALERAERRLRGARYKVPRFVHEEILSSPGFQGGLARLAQQVGRSEARLRREAARDLHEIAATHSPRVIDLVSEIFRRLYARSYGEVLRYDQRQLEEIAVLSQRHPLVFLPTHKSNLDHPVLRYALYENGLPPNHTAGGINMNFFPLGPLMRRAGVFFIRRSFKDDEVYKLVLHHYIDYLVAKRFALEWYIEGGRSRSGKLLPPRYGLLAYVVDACRRGKSDDVILVPVSIAYEQITDVGDYVAEQRGATKERESFGWFVRFVRRLGLRYGDIHIRFGEPLSLARELGPSDPRAEPDPDDTSLAVQKLAFEVCHRINRVTPVTPTSLVTLALLGVGERALSLDETVAALGNLERLVRKKKLPTTGELSLHTREGVRGALEALMRSGVVTCFAEGPEAVYAIGPNQHLAAAYYRNTIIHFFLTGAIAELALLHVAETKVPNRRETLLEEALRLRDLLKFEFFFAGTEEFRIEIAQEVAFHEPGWETLIEGSDEEIVALLRRFRPYSAHRVLRPFLESYQVVADALVGHDPGKPVDPNAFLSGCIPLAKQYALQRKIHSQESISKVYFQNALRLARNRGLLEPGGPEVRERRAAFRVEIADAVRRVDAIDALAAARRLGVES